MAHSKYVEAVGDDLNLDPKFGAAFPKVIKTKPGEDGALLSLLSTNQRR